MRFDKTQIMSLGQQESRFKLAQISITHYLVRESTEHLCLDIISELVEGQGWGPLEVREALLGPLHV